MPSKKANIYLSSSSEETKKRGLELAKAIAQMPGGRGGAVVIGLSGDLGAGKTTFIQGFTKGLGIGRGITSPTFVIMRRYAIRGARFKNIFHIDAYRLKEPAALSALGIDEIFGDPRNLVLIEWPERVKKILPKGTIWLQFKHGRKEHEREIRYCDIIKK